MAEPSPSSAASRPDPANVFAILLAGGSGTRFWPASRKSKPKQFLRIVGEDSMLGETFARLEGLVAPERVLVVTTAELVAEVRAALPAIPAANVLAEPVARSTGPCIALAALEVRRRDPKALQIVLPADHVIRPRDAFQRTLRAALRVAADKRSLCVFGIHPSFAATAFGWIQAGAVEQVVENIAVSRVERFIEKPDAARARAFLEQGGFFWNSGVFVWSTEAICAALEKHMPDAFAALAVHPQGTALATAYGALVPRSIDVAVLERAEGVRMLPIDYFWSDVGAWDSLAGVLAPDAHGNSACGGTALAAHDAHNCIVHGDDGSLTALIGVDDLIVVHAGDITLVCRRDRAQDVKALVERIARERPQFL
jgi:mannose-1-phosphate guanylyltransferase